MRFIKLPRLNKEGSWIRADHVVLVKDAGGEEVQSLVRLAGVESPVFSSAKAADIVRALILMRGDLNPDDFDTLLGLGFDIMDEDCV